jgi:hypothetical protein
LPRADAPVVPVIAQKFLTDQGRRDATSEFRDSFVMHVFGKKIEREIYVLGSGPRLDYTKSPTQGG